MRGWMVFAMLLGAVGGALAQDSPPPLPDAVIYDDEARNGFDGAYSFGGGTDLAQTGTVFSGTTAIAYTGSDEFNAVSFARAFVTDIDASRYHTLRFYVHGGATGGQRLRLYFARDSETESVTVADGVIDPYIVGGEGIVANEWRLVSVPLAGFGVDGPYDRIDLQTELGAQPVLYLDEIVLVGTPTIEVATVIVPRGTPSVAVPVRFFAGANVAQMQFSFEFVRGFGVATTGVVGQVAGALAPDATPLCTGPATTQPTATGIEIYANSGSGSALESGVLCTFTFPLEPSAPNGNYPFLVGSVEGAFADGVATPISGEFVYGGIVIADGTAPSVSYTPPPPSQIELPGGALGTPVQATINVQSLGGSGVGRVRLDCGVAGPFALPDGDTFLIGAGDEPLELAIGCTPGASTGNGTLECTETDEPGGTQRERSWPLLCPAGSSAGFAADDVTANRGGPVGVGIRFIGDGIVHSMAGEIVFDRTRLAPTQVAAANGANCFLRLPPNDDRIAFNAPAGPQPMPSAETTYCNVVFVLADDAPIDASPLTFAATNCLDAGNASVACATNDGSVTTSAFDSSPRPGSALSLVASGQSSVSGSILALNFGATAIGVTACTPEPADGFTITPAGAFSILASNFRTITVGCTAPAAGLPPRVTDVSCLLQDTAPARVVRYRVLCSNGSTQGALPGASLTGTGSAAGDEVGSALATAIAPNGDEIMVVGAPFGGADDGGRAFVLVRPAGSPPASLAAKRVAGIGAWDDGFALEDAHVLSATSAIGDKFGSAAAIDAAGETIAIGAPGGGAGRAGRVFVFERPPGGWGSLDTPDLVIDAPSGGAAGGTVPDEFGADVAFTANGMLVVGAPLADVGGAADAGAAYAYAAGSIVPAEVIVSPQVETGAGFASAIATDGDQVAFGAPLENAAGNADQGAVYVMTAPGAPAEPARRVTAAAGAIGDKFGQSVAIANRVLVVGAPSDNTATGTDAGSATVYSGDAGSGFVERMTLVPGGDATQQAGAAVATNGDVILVGAPFAPIAGRAAQGRVFAYDVPENLAGPPPSATIIDSAAGQAGDRFGARLATSPRRLLIGVPKDDNELGLGGTTVQIDEGRADPFLFDRIFRSGLE